MTTPMLRSDFPALANNDVVYLDHAATTQVPRIVLDAMYAYEATGRGNPGRGLHAWAIKAMDALDEARHMVAQFVGASPKRVVFTKSTTEGLNLVAQALGSVLQTGDEVILTVFEHHSSLLPWRAMADAIGFTIKVLPLAEDGTIDLVTAEKMMTARTKAVVATAISNVTGAMLPVQELGDLCRSRQVFFIVDGAQLVGHVPIDMSLVKCDALAFGAHKMYGPSGIGALAVSEQLWPHLRPLLVGGGAVDEVDEKDVRYLDDLRAFEAGSANVTGAVGFAAAVRYLMAIGFDEIRRHEQELTEYLLARLQELPQIEIYGPRERTKRTGVVSFAFSGVHSHDVAHVLADHGIAVRAGYHCAAPFTRCLNPQGTVRASIGLANTKEDIDCLIRGLWQVQKLFS